MTGNRATIILLLLLACVSLSGCGRETGWQRVDLPDESIPLPMNGRFRRANVQDLEVKMRDRMDGKDASVDQVLLTYYDSGVGDVVYMGSTRYSGGQWHTRDWDQPVEYMLNWTGAWPSRFYYVAVWTNSSEVHRIHIEVDGQSFDVEGEDMIVLRWKTTVTTMDVHVEHLEVTAFDEDGKVIWQDEW